MDIGSRATTDGIHIEQWSTANRHNNRPHTKLLVRAGRGAEPRPRKLPEPPNPASKGLEPLASDSRAPPVAAG